MKKIILCALTLAISSEVFAVKIAVIDSGTDTKHQLLQNKLWTNLKENPSTPMDDDQNGYANDVHGWNFANDNSELIDYRFGSLYDNKDLFKVFEIQKKSFLGTVTPEEKEWVKKKFEEPEFSKQIGQFGNFIHGTHVAKISSQFSVKPEVMTLKLLATSSSLLGSIIKSNMSKMNGSFGIRDKMLKYAMTKLAEASAKGMTPIGQYVSSMEATIVNGSFGFGPEQAANLVAPAFKLVFGREPSTDELSAYVAYFLQVSNQYQKAWVTSAPKALFVFAAGNDGMNNDAYPSSPASVGLPNVISVAATLGNVSLATFSNYGISTVDVAAPGVLITSAIPLDKTMEISGTSQASPYVAAVAARVAEINAKLTPVDIKAIIMGTVDKKDFLKDSVKSGGVVNPDRAFAAATESVKTTIVNAIALSRTRISDMPSKGYAGSTVKNVKKDLVSKALMMQPSLFN
jgi:subtilisin family serine protease